MSKYLEPKEATWFILFHLLISLYHACFNDSHLIGRQDKHDPLYLNQELMEEFIYKHMLLLPQSNTQKH